MIGLVRVNRGRWIVDCPNEECHWAYEAVAPTGAARYLHRCVGEPWKGPAGRGCGTMIELVWPSPDEAEQIVDVLSRRNLVQTRNWSPEETVDALMRENDRYLVGGDLELLVELGIGIPTRR